MRSDTSGGRQCCGHCRSLANRGLRMLHRGCYFAWCKKERVSIPGEIHERIAPEGAYRGFTGHRGMNPSGRQDQQNGTTKPWRDSA